MLERISSLTSELHDVEARLGDPAVQADPVRLAELGRRHKELSEIVAMMQQLRQAEADLQTARRLLSEAEGDDRHEWRAEIDELSETAAAAAEQLQQLMLPHDPNDDRKVIIEIRGAAGGEEANLFAGDLLGMYEAFARRQGWSFAILAASGSERGGFSEVMASLAGDSVWSRMRHEAGTHRVQRIPVTESAGRVHTSSATVMVIPEAGDLDVSIDDKDLRIDTYRSSGSGGQSVNTMDSAVRITHLPSGITVSMQDQKSQHRNKEKALRILRSRLLRLEQEKAGAEAAALRGEQVRSGDRSEKIRTYNFKENRVTDHRIGLTAHNLDRVLAGELGHLSDALVADHRRRLLENDPR